MGNKAKTLHHDASGGDVTAGRLHIIQLHHFIIRLLRLKFDDVELFIVVIDLNYEAASTGN